MAKDCECLIVCDRWLANERERVRRRSLGTNNWEQAKALAAQWLKWGQLLAPIEAALPNVDEISIEHAIQVHGSRCQVGEATGNKTACEDFVLSWRNLNPSRNRRNIERTEKLLSRTTKVAELGRLRYFLDYCLDSGWLTQNGAKNVRVEARGKGDPKYGLNPGEYERVLREARDWRTSWGNPGGKKAKELQVIVPLLRWSGLRISDAAMLYESRLRADATIDSHRSNRIVPRG